MLMIVPVIKGIKKQIIKFNKQLKKMIFQFGNGHSKKIINKLEKYRLRKIYFSNDQCEASFFRKIYDRTYILTLNENKYFFRCKI